MSGLAHNCLTCRWVAPVDLHLDTFCRFPVPDKMPVVWQSRRIHQISGEVFMVVGGRDVRVSDCPTWAPVR